MPFIMQLTAAKQPRRVIKRPIITVKEAQMIVDKSIEQNDEEILQKRAEIGKDQNLKLLELARKDQDIVNIVKFIQTLKSRPIDENTGRVELVKLFSVVLPERISRLFIDKLIPVDGSM